MNSLQKISSIKPRIKAAALHFTISAAVALSIASLVFGLWYPPPHHHLSGGLNLFLLVIGVDLVLGPLLTLVIFNISKPRRELVRDVLIIAAVQLAALLYGMNTVFQARPVYIVFEYNRFQVVYASDLLPEFLGKAPKEMARLPLLGPKYLSLRPIQAEERLDLLLQELSGFPLAYRADMWRPYTEAKDKIIAVGKSAEGMIDKLDSAQRRDLEKIMNKKNISVSEVIYLPVLSRSPDIATIFINSRNAEVLLLAKVDIDN